MGDRKSIESAIGTIGWRHRVLAENLQDVVWTMGLDGRFTYVSPSVTAQTGFLPEDYLSRPFVEFMTPESGAHIAELIQRQMALPPEQRLPSMILQIQERTKDGAVVDLEANASWMYDDDGNPAGIIGVTRDVSERKRAEQALRESEERFRAFVSLSSEGIVIHADGAIIDANQAAAAILGFPSAEMLIGKHAIDDIPFTPESKQSLQRQKDSASLEVRDAEILRPDGTRTRVLVRGRQTFLRGRLVRIASLLDITNIYETEQALRDSEGKFRIIGDSAPDALILINDEGLVEYWNPAAERMFGYTASEMQGVNVHAIVMPAAFGPRFESAFRKFRETGTGEAIGRIVELAAKRKDGAEFPIEIAVNPILMKGKFWSSAMVRDITDRKRAEEERKNLQEQLAQASKMEAIGRLAGGVAHDFNNLLTTILGYSEMILSQLSGNDSLRTEVEEISRAGERAAGLTQQLLAFSRKQVIQPRILDLNEAVKEARKMLERLIGENIKIVFDLDPDLKRIKADLHQIDQVLLNLAVNARDAMPKGGTLTVATANVTVGKEDAPVRAEIAPGSYAMLSVSDTGVGMDEATRLRVFEPFFSTKEVGKGTGLGLAMVYGIAKQNGGAVTVDSKPGRGTVFRIYLPGTDAVPVASVAPAGIGTPTGNEIVLLVEDDDMVQRLAQRILTRLGYDVIPARDTDDAIRICEERRAPIHLLLTDVIMPGMNGVELYARLRLNRAGLKALFMSGYAEDVVVRQGVLPEGTEFIQKPFNMEDLAIRVRQILDAL